MKGGSGHLGGARAPMDIASHMIEDNERDGEHRKWTASDHHFKRSHNAAMLGHATMDFKSISSIWKEKLHFSC